MPLRSYPSCGSGASCISVPEGLSHNWPLTSGFALVISQAELVPATAGCFLPHNGEMCDSWSTATPAVGLGFPFDGLRLTVGRRQRGTMTPGTRAKLKTAGGGLPWANWDAGVGFGPAAVEPRAARRRRGMPGKPHATHCPGLAAASGAGPGPKKPHREDGRPEAAIERQGGNRVLP